VTQAFVGYWLTTSGCGLKWDDVKGKALIANAAAAVEEQAQKGNVLAESLVGRLVNNGLIKPAAAADAATWYRRAAIHGDPSAMRIMSSLDDELGAAWLFEAAELGDVTALVFLGDRHLDGGRGVTRDRSRARDYYQRAADKSEPLGLTGLGGMYERGDLFAKSIPQAIKLYRQAADLGEDGAMVRLGLLLQKDNPREAVDWFRKSADEFGNTGGMFRLGQAYEAGTGVTKDDKVAVDWYQRAARRNHKEAQARLTALNLKW
jgi:TPR repeat protein